MTKHDTRIPISDATLSETVITAVAAAKGVDEIDLEPIYHVIDSEALDQLFEPQGDGTPRAHGRVSFTMAGCRVVVHGNRAVEVTPLVETRPLLECVDSGN